MKKIIGVFFSVFLLISLSGVANALSLPYSDLQDFDSMGTDYIIVNSNNEPFMYDHEIDFTPDADEIYNATVKIGYFQSQGTWTLSYGSQVFDLTGTDSYNVQEFELVLDPALIPPTTDEPWILSFSLNASGNYPWEWIYFDRSEVFGDYEPTPIPEPATMFLLGSGLIGLVNFGRKKFGK